MDLRDYRIFEVDVETTVDRSIRDYAGEQVGRERAGGRVTFRIVASDVGYAKAHAIERLMYGNPGRQVNILATREVPFDGIVLIGKAWGSMPEATGAWERIR